LWTAASTPELKLVLSLDQLTATSSALSATASKKAKVALLVELLQLCSASELPVVIAALTGEPRQGRIGVGWSTVYDRSDTPGAALNAEGAAVDPVPTVLEFDAFVDEVAALSGPGSHNTRQVLVDSFLARCSADTAAFVRNLFTGGLRQGSLQGLMIDAVAAALNTPSARLRRALTFNGDLGQLACLVLERGHTALDAVTIEVGRAMSPMLAATSVSVEAAMGELGRVSVEWKLDGARIQVHMRRSAADFKEPATVTLFTRNLNDITNRLPEVCAVFAALPVHSLVADGEVLGVNVEGKPAAFQDTMARVGSEAADAESEPPVALQPFLFDLLHLDGVDLIDYPLEERRRRLLEIAPTLVVPGCITDVLDEALGLQHEALALGHEGVMVKAASSSYDAGRRGSSWRKVKPVRTLDLVVLGAEWGHGRRTGWLSNLHLGARDDRPGAAPHSFVMVGKTFKGLTDALLIEQTASLLEREIRRSGITVHVRPELVVEIALDGIQRSSRYPGGVALRFARVKGYRPDRPADTADTISAVWALGQSSD
jgi:DNA ligase 1